MIKREKQPLLWESSAPFVLNLHLTKACNMRCVFCFGGFKETKTSLNQTEWEQLIRKVGQETAHLTHRRINFAGGEPLLVPYLSDLIRVAHEEGFEVSLITNGSRLTRSFIQAHRTEIQMIGISIDSIDPLLNKASGRTWQGRALSFNDYLMRCEWVKEAGLTLKVNTLIHRFNAHQDFRPLLEATSIDRWKVLRMLAIENENGDFKHWLPTDEAFYHFVQRHQTFSPVVENDDEIQQAYLFVSPEGYLMDNQTGDMKNGLNLLHHSLASAICHLNFRQEAYDKRYLQANER